MKARHEFDTDEEYKKYLRIYFTAMAMNGIISYTAGDTPDFVAPRAVAHADEILKQLEENKIS